MAQGILLVGGLGTRLLPLTRDVPKPMLPIAGLAITEHQLVKAKNANITSLVLATSYLSDVFVPYFGDGSRWGIELQYAVESTPLGTGGAIRHSAQLLSNQESIVIMNGDVLSSHNLAKQIALHESQDADVTLHLTHVDDARAFGSVPTDADNRVVGFLEKMDDPITNNINAGTYVFNPRILKFIEPKKIISIEREVFPQLIESGGKVLGYSEDSYWIDVGRPMALLQASIDIVEGRAESRALDGLAMLHRSHDFVAMQGSVISPRAEIKGGSAIGRNVEIGDDVRIEKSIISDGAKISSGVQLHRCFVASGVNVTTQAEFRDSFIGRDGVQPLIL